LYNLVELKYFVNHKFILQKLENIHIGLTQFYVSLNDIDIELIKSLTCSFVIAELHNNEDILKYVERADQAMNQAISNGRNQIIHA